MMFLIGILIAVTSGTVEVQRNNVWVAVMPGETLDTGEHIRTGAFSSAAVQLEPGKIITLNQGTQIQVREANGSQLVQLESGDMRVFSVTDIQVGAKDTMLQSVERPLDMQVGLEGDRLNVMVFSGSVRNGAVTIRGAQDSSIRTYTAGGSFHHGYPAAYPNFYIYPYFMYENPGDGRIVPPAVLNPTNPAYRPDQIVPPMSDPIRPPIRR